MKRVFMIAAICILAAGAAGCQTTSHSDNFAVREVTETVEYLDGETPYMREDVRCFGDYWANLFTR